MKCQEFQEKLNAYVDNELTESIEAFEEHLDTCETCRREYEDILELKSLMNDMPILDLPEGFEETLHEKLVQEKQKPVSIMSKYRTQIKWIGSLAAVAIVAITLVNNGFNMGSDVANTASFEAYNDKAVSDNETVLYAAVNSDASEESDEMVADEAIGAATNEITRSLEAGQVTVTFNEAFNRTYVDKGATYLISDEASDLEEILEQYELKNYEVYDNQYKFLVKDEDYEVLMTELKGALNVVEHYGEFYGDTVTSQEEIIANHKEYITSIEENKDLKKTEKEAIVANEKEYLNTLEEDLEKIKDNEGYKSITVIIVKE